MATDRVARAFAFCCVGGGDDNTPSGGGGNFSDMVEVSQREGNAITKEPDGLYAEDKSQQIQAILNQLTNTLKINDIADWAKQPTKPSYTHTEVGADAAGSAANAITTANGYTDQKIADLINGAPDTLDTLAEIAMAMGNNASVVEALDQAIGNKANNADLTSHTSNTGVHVTQTERNKWNGYESQIASAGNTKLQDLGVAVQIGYANGPSAYYGNLDALKCNVAGAYLLIKVGPIDDVTKQQVVTLPFEIVAGGYAINTGFSYYNGNDFYSGYVNWYPDTGTLDVSFYDAPEKWQSDKLGVTKIWKSGF